MDRTTRHLVADVLLWAGALLFVFAMGFNSGVKSERTAAAKAARTIHKLQDLTCFEPNGCLARAGCLR